MEEEPTSVLGDFSWQLHDANPGTRSRQTGSGANSPAYFPCLGPPISKLSIGLLNLPKRVQKLPNLWKEPE